MSAHAVTQAQLEGCLAEIGERDPFIVPAPVAVILDRGGKVAVVDGTVAGVGWRQMVSGETQVDVRVRPTLRRAGVGGRLFDALSNTGVLLANCDAAHPRARRFVEQRGFEPVGVVFHQRWDGEVEDVPPAFRTASLTADPDPNAVFDVLDRASADSWPPHLVTREELARGQLEAWVARDAGERVAALVASHDDDAWCIGGFAVMPSHRARGVGRALLTDLMRRAAQEGLGVTMRVSHENERVLRWSQTLGFWTYRTWAYYRRPAVGSAG